MSEECGTALKGFASSRWTRAALRWWCAATVAVLVGVALPSVAAAHTGLSASDPADGATLTESPRSISLTFNQSILEVAPVVIVVTGPDGLQYQTGTPSVDGAVATSELTAIDAAGVYAVAYRVVSNDGHPVEGQISFQFQPPVPASTADPLTSSPDTSAADSTELNTTAAATAPSSQSPTVTADPLTSSPDTSAALDTATAAALEPTATESNGLPGWVWPALIATAVVMVAAIGVFTVQRRR